MQPVPLDDPDYRRLDDWFTQIGIVKDAFTELMLSIQSPEDFSKYDACFALLEYRFTELIDKEYPSIPLIFSS